MRSLNALHIGAGTPESMRKIGTGWGQVSVATPGNEEGASFRSGEGIVTARFPSQRNNRATVAIVAI